VPTQRLEVQAAVNALPRAHALLLRGAMSGFDDHELARLVGVPDESIRPLVRLAAAKLVSLLGEPGTG
jgi:DNA-directed RNA polymerase specialized sigma24 family protein